MQKDDANIVKVLEDGLKASAIRIPGTLQDPHGFDSVHSVTSYLSAFGVTVAERIREQFQPLFDPAAEQLSPEILRINDYIRKHAGYSLYPAQLAVAESVKRKLSEGKSAFIVAECGSGKTKIGATALATYQAQKRKRRSTSFSARRTSQRSGCAKLPKRCRTPRASLSAALQSWTACMHSTGRETKASMPSSARKSQRRLYAPPGGSV